MALVVKGSFDIGRNALAFGYLTLFSEAEFSEAETPPGNRKLALGG
jgi:hypothetical protein